jgi:hypothetical protein
MACGTSNLWRSREHELMVLSPPRLTSSKPSSTSWATLLWAVLMKAVEFDCPPAMDDGGGRRASVWPVCQWKKEENASGMGENMQYASSLS